MRDKLIIFDTTLRDGEQSPGASMTQQQKVRIARQLERLKVDVIEAGFAVASQGDFEAVQAVAREIKESIVCSLSRTRPMDIERAAEAIAPAPRRRIHTFIATSPIHMAKKLRMSPEQVVEEAVNAVRLARNFTDDVEFSCEDAGRSELDFLCQIIEKVIKAGARTINIPDTVGYTMPHEYGLLIKNLIEKIPNSDQAIFSVHCHNDLGLAVANSLSAVLNGARQVECTINGLGERAGNAALEEIVMAIRTRPMMFDVETCIDATQIVPASRLVSGITGFPVQPNKAIVGANAFAHESGIHQDGVLKHRETYEIMRAEDVGWHTNRMVLGKLSGRSAVKDRLEKLGVTFENPRELDQFFKKFKDLADKKQEIFDEDLQALLSDNQAENQSQIIQEYYQLNHLKVTTESHSKPFAKLIIHREGKDFETEAEGDGAVDASFKAIEFVAKSQAKLLLYSVNNVTSGTDSQGEVTVRLSRDGRVVNGNGADTDIVIASVKAYLNALNKLGNPAHLHPQQGV